jgi:hypothetical protein
MKKTGPISKFSTLPVNFTRAKIVLHRRLLLVNKIPVQHACTGSRSVIARSSAENR